MTKLRALQSCSQSGKPYFTTEAQSSPSSEYFLIKYFLLRALCGREKKSKFGDMSRSRMSAVSQL